MTPPTQRLAAAAAGVLERRLSRRSLFARAAVVGSAVTTTGLDFVLRPGTAYASVCGTAHTCAAGWTVMCCSINNGVNQCPPGSFAGGWWKAADASLCGGQARYYIDCQGECTHCGCHGSHFCAEDCWNCKPHCGHGSCDERRVCHNVFRYGQCDRHVSCSGPVLCRVISCTPPWKWANCSTASATDDFTVSHSAPCLPRWTEIQQRYTHLGSQGSTLGTTVGAERHSSHGRVQHYTSGRMYWTSATGARYLTGAVLHRYEALDELASSLGPPTSDVRETPDQLGHHATFRNGAIYQRHGQVAYSVLGGIYSKWLATGLIKGPLGYPIADQAATSDRRGAVAHFEDGVILRGPGLAAHDLYGDLAHTYVSLGAERSPLGYPIADQSGVVNAAQIAGQQVRCQDGAVLQATGADAFALWDVIYRSWLGTGGVTGSLGYPTSSSYDVTLMDGPGLQCTFEHGSITYNETTKAITIVTS